MADAGGNISPDWRFGIAYNGALKLCTILLHASGYRPEKTLQHYRAITAMPMILGAGREDDADYLDRCRRKRNIAEYDRTDVVTEGGAQELIEFTKELRASVLQWLEQHHPNLVSEERA